MNKDRVILIVTTSLIVLALFFVIDRKNYGNSVESSKMKSNISTETVTQNAEEKLAKVGEVAPNFKLENLDGDFVTLEEFRGKTIFINFWASWCEDCTKEMEALEKLNGNSDIQVLSINVREDYKAIERFVDEKDLDLEILLDKDGSIGLDYLVGKLPTTYVVDPNGILSNKVIGPMNYEIMLREVEKTQ